MQKTKALFNYRRIINAALAFISFTVLVACQSASSDEVKASDLDTELAYTLQNGYRVDQSVIQANDNRIFQASHGINRAIPDLDDSNISYCESVDGIQGKYNGVRDLSKYPLASLSKIFLSAWALDKLGAGFKFENAWHLKKIAGLDSVYDVYFKANYDPALNIEKMLYAMSVLNANGVKKIRKLVIDESTRVYLSVLNDPHVELGEVPVSINQSIQNLDTILNSTNWGSQTDNAKSNLINFGLEKNRQIIIPNNFSVAEVAFIPRQQIRIADYDSVVKIKSAVLLRYLKDINVNSNNYMSDAFFRLLGGASEFKKFQVSRLNITDSDLLLHSGSGLPILGMGLRNDNLGSCVAILKTLKFIKNLSVQLGFNMGHILLTAGVDNGTYQSILNINFNKNIVIKTGRLFDVPALNVAGTASLENGTLFFAYLAHHFNNDDEVDYKMKRDRIMNSILDFYPVRTKYETTKVSSVLLD